jgi:hypothetical protein
VRHGRYVTVAVNVDQAERAHVVLERQRRPGAMRESAGRELGSLAAAVYQAEAHVLARGGWLGAEAEGLASSPVARDVAAAMFSPSQRGRFVHLRSEAERG